MDQNLALMESSKEPTTMLKAVKSWVMDGWMNILTGLGSGNDKRMGTQISYRRMSDTEADNLYGTSDTAARIVDIEPEDAIRQWFTFTCSDETVAGKVDTVVNDFKVATKFSEAWSWARLYGGSAIFMNCDDSKLPSEPLDLNAIRKLKSLIILEKRDLSPASMDNDLDSKHFGEPLTYRINTANGTAENSGAEIHRSRLILWYGVKLPPRMSQSNDYWGDSVLNRCQEAIVNHAISNNAVATILQEFNQGVFKMRGLAEMLLAGHDKEVQKRLSTVQLSRSICRAVVIDSEAEEFTNVGAHVTGIPDMLRTVDKRLVVASRMPHTKILGESPSGLGATGQSEEKNWNDHVSNQQEIILRPRVQQFLEVILHSKDGPTKGVVPKDWKFEFNPLVQQTEKEKIDNRKTQADADKIYIETGVVDPTEVRRSRFPGGVYSFETMIDTNLDPTAKPKEVKDPIVEEEE